jgi:methionyl-tRNA formyltransferase
MNDAPRGPGVTLFLMTQKGYAVLRHLCAHFLPLLDLVVVGTDKALEDDFERPIIELCREHGIAWRRRAEFDGVVNGYAVAVAWRWMIDHPADRLIVFHDSLLPRYRGFAPLVNSLINGEPEIGVTAILGAADYDAGDIVAAAGLPVHYPIKIGEAIALNQRNYLAVADDVFGCLFAGRALPARPQAHEHASYSVWRDDLDYRIDWGRSATQIRRHVDAVGPPYKGACTTVDGRLARILDVVEMSDLRIENRAVGKVLMLDQGLPVVICGEGLLKLTKATVDDNGSCTDLLPLPRFRVRFGS